MKKQYIKYRVIYAIKCLHTGKIYVGSAEKWWNRLYCHITALNANKHANNYLQNAWNKYGRNGFIFGIVEELSDNDNIVEKEQYWMDFYKACDRSKGFNIHPYARTSFGYRHTKETKLKQSASKKGKKWTKNQRIVHSKRESHPNPSKGKDNPLSKPIIQMSLDGKNIKEWESINICRINLGLHKSGIQACLKNKISQTGGFKFKYK